MTLLRPHRMRQSALGLLLVAAATMTTQAASSSESQTDSNLPTPQLQMAQVLSDPQAAQQTTPSADGAGKKSGKRPKKSRAHPSATTPVADADKVQELMRLTGAQLEQRIDELRRALRHSPRDEPSRQMLGLIAVEIANRILDLDARDRKEEIAHWMAVVRDRLQDTFWRTTQLAKSDARSAAALGLFYSEGILTQPAADKACELYTRAARQGHVAAAYQAALCTARTDPALAKSLLERAAAKGHAGAQELMGRACIEGVHRDIECAFDWLGRAAAQGRPSAISVLGWLYASDPAHRDLEKSVTYYRQAAAAGDLAAQNNLGEFYETGRGVERDASEAFRWYLRAADAGFAPAQLNLARLYGAGSGVARDASAARLWAERAKKQGLVQAQELLDWLNSGSSAKR